MIFAENTTMSMYFVRGIWSIKTMMHCMRVSVASMNTLNPSIDAHRTAFRSIRRASWLFGRAILDLYNDQYTYAISRVGYIER